MDLTEDLSARVLLTRILHTEIPRTPVTRSGSQAQSDSGLRRSVRLSRKADAQTPQDLIRRSMKHNIRDSITHKSLPSTKRRTMPVISRRPSSTTFINEDVTPRHLLKNILQTEPVKSPVVHHKGPYEAQEPQPLSAENTVNKTCPSTELSGFDLPDITIGNVASTAKGLARKRPRRSLNVTAFEKRLKEGNEGAEEESKDSSANISSVSLSSSTSLSLKTPFVDVQTGKKGLQRRVINRRKITEEEFAAAVNKRQLTDVSSQGIVECLPFDSSNFEDLSKLMKPDITVDIVDCNTALYDHPNASLSLVATQDKPTVLASQLQKDIGQMEEEQENLFKESKNYEEIGNIAESQSDDAPDPVVMSESEEVVCPDESEADVLDDNAKSAEEGSADSPPEDEDMCYQGEAEVSTNTRTEEKEESSEDDLGKSQSEEVELDPQPKTDQMEHAKTEELESEKEELPLNSQTEDEVFSGSHSEDDSANSTQVGVTESDEDEARPDGEYSAQRAEEEEESEQQESDLEHISQRTARHSEGALVLCVPKDDSAHDSVAGSKLKAQNVLYSNDDVEAEGQTGSHHQTEEADLSESTATDQEHENKENGSFHLLGAQDVEDGVHGSDASPGDAPDQDAAEQDDGWEDEEDNNDDYVDEFPTKTPAFVREKRNFFLPATPASPSAFEKTQSSAPSKPLPAAKPKQVRRRKSGSVRGRGVLPRAYLMSVFRHFAKTKVSSDVYPVLNEIMDKFLSRVAEDLEAYAGHAKRKTIEVEDVKLLLKRQGHISDKVPVEVLIEKYLRMEQRKLLIPIATSGNVVIPKLQK